jgi:16S rRNA (uracil1498-N3)-methyltransferase
MVLRLREGDLVYLTNGYGTLFEARIIDASGRQVAIEVISRQDAYGRRDYRLHMAVAPTKNIDRFEWFLEKATEIGVDEITPLICEHSERRQLRTDRLEKVITAAMKQSLKTYHPVLNKPESLTGFLAKPLQGSKYIAFIKAGTPLLIQLYHKGADAIILIGPEGDFSLAEAEAAVKSGYKIISLGESRLRTETAALVACHTISLINQAD